MRKPGYFKVVLVSIVLSIIFLAVTWGEMENLGGLFTPIKNVYDKTNRSRDPASATLSPIHVMFGLSGNHSGFLSEFEVALKSVLLNAPLERNLSVHILADQDAYNSLHEIFNRTKLSSWVTRNPVEIYAYNVSPELPSLQRKITELFRKAMNRPDFRHQEATKIHTIGTFFRLFAHHFVPPTVKHLLYIDTDVVIMANLEELWQQVERAPDALFHWGAGMCAGFVVMNAPRLEDIWTLAQNASMEGTNDQFVFQAVNVTYPQKVNILSEGWDMSVTHRWQVGRIERRRYDEAYPNVGMLHINGGRESKEAYFKENEFLEDFSDTWGIAKYYATIPWPWARYQALSLARPNSRGHLIKIVY